MTDTQNFARFGRPLTPTTALLRARQLLHARLGLPMAAAGGVLLIVVLLHNSQVPQLAAIGIIAAAVAFAVVAITIGEWRIRKQGVWARSSGDPSLAAPHDQSEANPATVAWLQLAALLILAAIVVSAYFSGVAADTVFFWIALLGIFHMAIYSLCLWFKLQMVEQILPFAWFVLGGLYWMLTRDSAAIVFGGGWVLLGLLLYARQRHFEKLAYSLPDDSEVNAP